METTSYGKAWRAFRKQNFGLCSTTYYSNVPICNTCRQTQIHRTQSLHYDKSLKRSSLQHIVTTSFAATIYRGDLLFCFARYRCNEVLLRRYLGEISRRLYRYLADLCFNVRQSMRCFADISVINRENKAQYLLIIVCITFAQYCKSYIVSDICLLTRSNFTHSIKGKSIILSCNR